MLGAAATCKVENALKDGRSKNYQLGNKQLLVHKKILELSEERP